MSLKESQVMEKTADRNNLEVEAVKFKEELRKKIEEVKGKQM